MVTGRMDIHGQFVRTSESATDTKLLVTTGSSNHGGMGLKSTLGQGGRQYVSQWQEKDGGGVTND
jgi:hypothetical protein